MDRDMKRSLSTAILLVGVVAATTAASVSGLGPSAAALAFNPTRLAQGRVWLLVASALVVDHPLVLSLLSFAVLAVATMAVCGRRIFWSAAIYGHLGSTLAVYAFIGAARLLDPGAFASALNARDYGVSAISSAWLGATATAVWLVRTARRSHATVVIGCCAIALFAYMIRRDTSVLSSEHLVAFVIGIGISLPRGMAYRGISRFAARHRAAVRTVGATACTLLVVAVGTESPEAFAQFKALFVPPGATVSGCVQRWNSAHRGAFALPMRWHSSVPARVDVVRSRLGVVCRFRLSAGSDGVLTYRAFWRSRGLGRFQTTAAAAPSSANAVVVGNGLIRLRRQARDFDLLTGL